MILILFAVLLTGVSAGGPGGECEGVRNNVAPIFLDASSKFQAALENSKNQLNDLYKEAVDKHSDAVEFTDKMFSIVMQFQSLPIQLTQEVSGKIEAVIGVNRDIVMQALSGHETEFPMLNCILGQLVDFRSGFTSVIDDVLLLSQDLLDRYKKSLQSA